jgi:hypothetical protein
MSDSRSPTVRRTLFPALSIAVVLSLAMAGCSSSDAAEDLDPNKSPLTEYTEVIYGNQDQDEFAKQQVEVEKLVATCMAEEGFEYIPVDQNQGQSFSSDDMEDTNTEEWVASHGYGMSQTPEEIEESNDNAVEWVDPNQPYVESLSEGEMTAYYEVLYGAQPTDEELNDDGSYDYKWENAGCQGAAQHEIQGESVYEQEEHKALFDSINEIYTDVEADPKVKKLNSEWAACMADAGYPDYKAKQEAVQDVIDKSNALWEENPETGPTEEQQAEAREYEIEIALADFKCADAMDYTNKVTAVQFELEEQFITDHKAELDAIVAEVEKSNK